MMTVSLSSRPVMTRTERLWRIKAELKATAPYTCPHCSAGGPVPAFVRGADVWICADWRCARWFVVRD